MSYITMSSEEVRIRCSKSLEWIKEKREELKEVVIQDIIERSKKSWLRKLFWLKPYTREEALNIYDSLDWVKLGIDISYGRSEEKARNLLHLARFSDTVQVSSEDWSYIR